MTDPFTPTLEDLVDLEDSIAELHQVLSLLVNANENIIAALEDFQTRLDRLESP